MVRSDLFIIPKPLRNPRLRLFCFPYAGGSAGIYIPWAQHLDEGVELVAVQPPGRANRMMETPHDTMEALVDELHAHAAFVTSVPYIFFGHSLGSRVAYEFSCRLQAAGHCPPQHFIASGSRAPHVGSDRERIYDLPQREFIAKLQQLNGTPKEALANEELMELILPVLRADFKMADKYLARKMAIRSPITVLSGTEDTEITQAQLQPWEDLSNQTTRIEYIPGDHFFINQNRTMVIDMVKSIVAQCS